MIPSSLMEHMPIQMSCFHGRRISKLETGLRCVAVTVWSCLNSCIWTKDFWCIIYRIIRGFSIRDILVILSDWILCLKGAIWKIYRRCLMMELVRISKISSQNKQINTIKPNWETVFMTNVKSWTHPSTTHGRNLKKPPSQ
jgi:hypothetical protein